MTAADKDAVRVATLREVANELTPKIKHAQKRADVLLLGEDHGFDAFGYGVARGEYMALAAIRKRLRNRATRIERAREGE